MAQSLLRACRRGVAAYAKLPLGLRRLTPRAAWVSVGRFRTPTIEHAPHEGGRVTLGQALDAQARVEMAVGVLMELCGWNAITARSRLLTAAVSVDASVEHVAEFILALGPEHPAR